MHVVLLVAMFRGILLQHNSAAVKGLVKLRGYKTIFPIPSCAGYIYL